MYEGGDPLGMPGRRITIEDQAGEPHDGEYKQHAADDHAEVDGAREGLPQHPHPGNEDTSEQPSRTTASRMGFMGRASFLSLQAAAAFSTRRARSVTHLLGCFFAPKSTQVLPA